MRYEAESSGGSGEEGFLSRRRAEALRKEAAHTSLTIHSAVLPNKVRLEDVEHRNFVCTVMPLEVADGKLRPLAKRVQGRSVTLPRETAATVSGCVVSSTGLLYALSAITPPAAARPAPIPYDSDHVMDASVFRTNCCVLDFSSFNVYFSVAMQELVERRALFLFLVRRLPAWGGPEEKQGALCSGGPRPAPEHFGDPVAWGIVSAADLWHFANSGMNARARLMTPTDDVLQTRYRNNLPVFPTTLLTKKKRVIGELSLAIRDLRLPVGRQVRKMRPTLPSDAEVSSAPYCRRPGDSVRDENMEIIAQSAADAAELSSASRGSRTSRGSRGSRLSRASRLSRLSRGGARAQSGRSGRGSAPGSQADGLPGSDLSDLSADFLDVSEVGPLARRLLSDLADANDSVAATVWAMGAAPGQGGQPTPGAAILPVDLSGSLLLKSSFEASHVTSLALSPRAAVGAAAVLCGSGVYNIILYNYCTGEPFFVLGTHFGYVYRLAFSADGQLLASVGGDGVCLLYDMRPFGLVSKLALQGDAPASGPGADPLSRQLAAADVKDEELVTHLLDNAGTMHVVQRLQEIVDCFVPPGASGEAEAEALQARLEPPRISPNMQLPAKLMVGLYTDFLYRRITEGQCVYDCEFMDFSPQGYVGLLLGGLKGEVVLYSILLEQLSASDDLRYLNTAEERDEGANMYSLELPSQVIARHATHVNAVRAVPYGRSYMVVAGSSAGVLSFTRVRYLQTTLRPAGTRPGDFVTEAAAEFAEARRLDMHFPIRELCLLLAGDNMLRIVLASDNEGGLAISDDRGRVLARVEPAEIRRLARAAEIGKAMGAGTSGGDLPAPVSPAAVLAMDAPDAPGAATAGPTVAIRRVVASPNHFYAATGIAGALVVVSVGGRILSQAPLPQKTVVSCPAWGPCSSVLGCAIVSVAGRGVDLPLLEYSQEPLWFKGWLPPGADAAGKGAGEKPAGPAAAGGATSEATARAGNELVRAMREAEEAQAKEKEKEKEAEQELAQAQQGARPGALGAAGATGAANAEQGVDLDKILRDLDNGAPTAAPATRAAPAGSGFQAVDTSLLDEFLAELLAIRQDQG